MPITKQDRTLRRRHFVATAVFGVPLLALLTFGWWDATYREGNRFWLVFSFGAVMAVVGLILQQRRFRRFRCPDCGHRLPNAERPGGARVTYHCHRCNVVWDTGFVEDSPDMPIEETVRSRALQKLKNEKPTHEMGFSPERLMLRWPQNEGGGWHVYQLVEPTSLKVAGVAVGKELVKDRYCTVLACSEQEIAVATLMTTGIDAHIYCSLPNNSVNEWVAVGFKTQHSRCEFRSANFQLSLLGDRLNLYRITEPSGSDLMATFSREVVTWDSGKARDPNSRTDCVYDKGLGSSYLEIATIVALIRSWVADADFR